MSALYEALLQMKTAQISAGALNNIAWQLSALRAQPCRVPPLVYFHDPVRGPDIRDAARALPEHCAVVYRHFGTEHRVEIAQDLREITAARAQVLLIGADPKLAEQINADGVHFRRDPGLVQPALWRDKRPDWIITMAGLKSGRYHIPLTLLDAVFISAVFPSRSPSAGAPLGPEQFAALCAELDTSVFALGGVNALTAPRLIGTGAAGLAAIDGFFKQETKTMDVKREDTANGFRFVIYDDLGEAELTMRKVDATTYDANHTGVPKSLGGRGVGKQLIAAMVVDAKANEYKVIPSCPFVEAMFKRKPEWNAVRA